MLPCDVLCKIMAFVGPGHYRFVGGACRDFREAYTRQHFHDFETSGESVVGSIQTAELYIAEKLSSITIMRGTTTPPSRKQYEYHHATFHSNVAMWACQYGRLDLLKWTTNNNITDYNPAVLNRHRHTMLDRAVEGGHIECFQFLNKAKSGRGCLIKEHYLVSAARHGQLAFLRHYYEKGNRFLCKHHACIRAAVKHGHLHVLQFLHKVSQCPFPNDICYDAARRGHLDCLIYLHQNGAELVPSLLKIPAATGNVECLGYIFEIFNGYWQRPPGTLLLKEALKQAATSGHLECLAFLFENGVDNWKDSDVEMALEASARNGRLHCLVFLLEQQCNGFQITNSALERALVTTAAIGALDCFVYLLHGNSLEHHSWSRSVMEETLLVTCVGYSFCHFDLLDYLLDFQGDDWDSVIIHQALERLVRRENLDRLSRLLKVDGVQWDRALLSQLSEEAEHVGAIDCADCIDAFLTTISSI